MCTLHKDYVPYILRDTVLNVPRYNLFMHIQHKTLSGLWRAESEAQPHRGHSCPPRSNERKVTYYDDSVSPVLLKNTISTQQARTTPEGRTPHSQPAWTQDPLGHQWPLSCKWESRPHIPMPDLHFINMVCTNKTPRTIIKMCTLHKD